MNVPDMKDTYLLSAWIVRPWLHMVPARIGHDGRPEFRGERTAGIQGRMACAYQRVDVLKIVSLHLSGLTQAGTEIVH